MSNKNMFKDDVIEHIEDDVKKIRRKPGMYISYLGYRGALHLAKELVNNNIDEAMNPESPGRNIDVHFDENTNTVTSIDDGRGLPFESVVLVSTKLQSGSKFDKEGSDSAGENGVGLTAVNSLSEELKYTIFRNGNQKGIFKFHEGELVEDKISTIKADDKHGTMISFKPSTQILGPCQIPVTELSNWVDKLSYLIDPKINLKLHLLLKGKEAEITTKLKRKNGFFDYMDVFCKERIVAPINIECQFEDIRVQLSFTYDHNLNEEKVDSFVNFVNTVDDGVHVNAARYAITSCISKMAKGMLSDAEQKKIDINNDDCKNGLVIAMNMFCKKPGFTGQTKEKIGNDELFKPIRTMVYNEVFKFLKNNPKELKRIFDHVKRVARARLETNKIKKSDYAPSDNFSENALENFAPATGNGYKELYLVEGGSAKGTIVNARDPRYQAVYALRGVSLNSFSSSLAKIKDNDEFRNLIKILGCGMGKDFNINNLKYDKIIIMTDSDIDGYNITSLISVFFFMHLRPIVMAGKLFKAVAPLYRVKNKGNIQYVVSKGQYFDITVNEYVNKISLIDSKGNKLNKDNMRKLFYENKTYLGLLKKLYGHFYLHPDIIEFLIVYRKDKDFAKKLKSTFKELVVEDDSISGAYEGSYQYIHLDDKFDDKVQDLEKLICENGRSIYYQYNDGNYNSERPIPLGNILYRCEDKFRPSSEARWKGLGSIPNEVFWDTTLDPEKRSLIQLNIETIDKDLYRFRILHGDDPQLRRDLLENYVLDREDIDN